jgi:hypothetical protein
MTNPINVEIFDLTPPVGLINLDFDFTEKSIGEVESKIGNFRRFYGEDLKSAVVVYSIWSKRHQHDLLLVYTVGSATVKDLPFALAAFYTKVSNLYSDNPNDRKDVGQYILADNVRIPNAFQAAGFTEKVNQKAFEILQRINGF